MEEVLDLYAQPYDLRHPTVNFDEMSKQLIEETRTPVLAEVGQLERFDYEYRCENQAKTTLSINFIVVLH